MHIRQTHESYLFPFKMPYVLHAGQFSQCGGKERVITLEVYSPKKVFVKTERGLSQQIQHYDNSLSGIDEKSFRVYLQNIALQVIALSDGGFKISHHVTGCGGGTGSSKSQTSSKPKTLSYNEKKNLWFSCSNDMSENIDYINKLLKYPHYTEDSFFYDGSSIVVHASHYGRLEMLKLLLQKGANINAQNHKNVGGSTALISAVYECHLDIVEFLVESGADTDLTNESNYSALSACISGNRIEIARYLVKKVKNIDLGDPTPLAAAIAEGRLELVELFLSNGADLKKVPAEIIQKASETVKKLLARKD